MFRSPRLAAAATLACALTVGSAAHAKLTTGVCLAQKRTAWGTLRKCQATGEAKQLKGKPADLPKCQTKFQDALAKISAKATKAVIACRYGDNGDGTVTDYDTGLQWERKIGGSCSNAFVTCFSDTDCPAGTCVATGPHFVNGEPLWADAMSTFISDVNEHTDTRNPQTSGLGGHNDWRLPSVDELQTILVPTPPCVTQPCIDPIFGPSMPFFYWSSTTKASDPTRAWSVLFGNGAVNPVGKGGPAFARAVRSGL